MPISLELIKRGFERVGNHSNYSTMVKGGVFHEFKRGSDLVGIGLSEKEVPPCLISPIPYVHVFKGDNFVCHYEPCASYLHGRFVRIGAEKMVDEIECYLKTGIKIEIDDFNGIGRKTYEKNNKKI